MPIAPSALFASLALATALLVGCAGAPPVADRPEHPQGFSPYEGPRVHVAVLPLRNAGGVAEAVDLAPGCADLLREQLARSSEVSVGETETVADDLRISGNVRMSDTPKRVRVSVYLRVFDSHANESRRLAGSGAAIRAEGYDTSALEQRATEQALRDLWPELLRHLRTAGQRRARQIKTR